MKQIRMLQVVQVGGSRYGPGKARDAACAWASEVSIDFHSKRKGFRDFNDYHRVAFHRSLHIFERLLGKTKNRTNPRTLIDLDLNNMTATVVQN